MMPILSVIIPIYNTEKFLGQCLESVIKQSYKNLDILLIDDGSTDNSSKICEKYQKKDNRIRFLKLNHQGKSNACNEALKLCHGEYISIIDSDDWLELNMYDILVDNLKSDSLIDISVCGYYKCDKKKNLPIVNEKNVPRISMDMKKFMSYIYERDTYKGVGSYLWNRIIRRELITKSGIFFRKDINICEDVLFTAQCYLKAKKIIYTPMQLYYYRQRDGSLMHTPEERLKSLSACKVYKELITIFEEFNIDDNVIRLIKRFYVYHAGVALEYIYRYKLKKYEYKITILRQYILDYLSIYIEMNKRHPQNIIWIKKILEESCNANV